MAHTSWETLAVCHKYYLDSSASVWYNRRKGERGEKMEHKVNRVAVLLDDDVARISLYRTNQKLAEITNFDLHIPSYDNSGMPNKSLYQNYCRDLTIHLLQQGGITGYYYEEKQSGESIKYDKSSFKHSACKSIGETLDSMGIENNISTDCEPDITELYKDKYVKDGQVDININIGEEHIVVPINIKSGQMCKPKMFRYKDNEYTFNITNLNKIVKGVI